MERQQAIEKYARIILSELSVQERIEQLEIMAFEDWTDIPDWNELPSYVQKKIAEGEPLESPQSEIYDPVLMMWLKNGLYSVTNEFLCQKLNVDSIKGNPIELQSCPCCGFKTIGERGNYEICTVCWWEDNGQDNKHSDEIMAGPNYGISLIQGRYNFIMQGLYDPNRQDLMKLKAENGKYARGREFQIIEGKYLIEVGTNWKTEIKMFLNKP